MRRVVSLGFVVLFLTKIGSTFIENEENSHYVVIWNFDKKKEDISGSQFIQDCFGWHILSGVGLLGTLSHLFLMHCFYAERTVLATSVNAMICMDTLHKLIYASIIVHWRNYAMVSGKPIFEEWLGKSNVRTHSLSLHVTIILYLFYNIAVFTCVLYTLNVSRTIVQHRR